MSKGEWRVGIGKRSCSCHCVFSDSFGEEIGMVNAHTIDDAVNLAAQIVREHNTRPGLVEALRKMAAEGCRWWSKPCDDGTIDKCCSCRAADALRKAGEE